MRSGIILLSMFWLAGCASVEPERSAPRTTYTYRAGSAPRVHDRTLPAPERSVSAHSYAAPRPSAPAARPRPSGGGYYRLRGSVEIHVASCRRVRRAAREGAVPARVGDGPPCFSCRKADAMRWSR